MSEFDWLVSPLLQTHHIKLNLNIYVFMEFVQNPSDDKDAWFDQKLQNGY